MMRMLTCFLFRLAYGSFYYVIQTAMAKDYQQIIFNADYGFVGLPSGSSLQTFNLVNGSFVEAGTLDSVASATKAVFAK